jgi:ABC-type nitrate/sulfonate/bicarbonate transport system substrate-binding protein
LSWRHSTQFAGFYEAEQDGLYEAEGLVVEFLEGGPEISGLDAVLDGRADIGVAGADELLIARSQGYSVKAIAVVYQISPIVFVSKAELDFTQPQDFVGKKIRVTANLQPTLDAMMSNVGVAQDQYDPIILPSDVDAFASGEVPVWGAYVNGLALQIQQTGIDINIVYPSDYGARFYADTIFTTEEMIEENPEIVEKFLRASLNGWETVIAQPEVVLDTISIYAPDVEPELQRQRMLASIPLIFTGLDPIGSMNLATWSQMGPY